jgi:hypothetical protein
LFLASAVIWRTELDYTAIVPENVSGSLSLARQLLFGSDSLYVEGTTDPFKNT